MAPTIATPTRRSTTRRGGGGRRGDGRCAVTFTTLKRAHLREVSDGDTGTGARKHATRGATCAAPRAPVIAPRSRYGPSRLRLPRCGGSTWRRCVVVVGGELEGPNLDTYSDDSERLSGVTPLIGCNGSRSGIVVVRLSLCAWA